MNQEVVKKGHPKGLYVLFATEFWERFSYYGMRAIFVLFMTDKLLFDKAYASNIYGSYTGLVYLTPLIGGYMADRYWGNRKSIFVGGFLMAIGQFILFFCASLNTGSPIATTLLWTGLAFLIFGNGFFKQFAPIKAREFRLNMLQAKSGGIEIKEFQLFHDE